MLWADFPLERDLLVEDDGGTRASHRRRCVAGPHQERTGPNTCEDYRGGKYDPFASHRAISGSSLS
jgi:hypothetical protein